MRRADKIKLIAVTMAESLFREFHEDPNMRGPAFTWERFPDMAGRWARRGLFTSFPYRKEPTAEEEALCAKAARERAEALVKEHGLG